MQTVPIGKEGGHGQSNTHLGPPAVKWMVQDEYFRFIHHSAAHCDDGGGHFNPGASLVHAHFELLRRLGDFVGSILKIEPKSL